MGAVDEILAAIVGLPRNEFWELTDRLFIEVEAAQEGQLEENLSTVSLDVLWTSAEQEIESGMAVSLDEFLEHLEL